MPSSTITKVQSFGLGLAQGKFNFTPGTGHTFKYYLSATAPDAANDVVRADLPTELANGNGYTTGGIAVTVASLAQSGGTTKCVMNDVTLTAAGGSIGPFQYITLVDETAANDDVVGFYNYGTPVTILDGESFVFDADGTTGAFTIA